MTPQEENARLRAALSQIGGFANSWAEETTAHPLVTKSRFHTIEATAKAALEETK